METVQDHLAYLDHRAEATVLMRSLRDAGEGERKLFHSLLTLLVPSGEKDAAIAGLFAAKDIVLAIVKPCVTITPGREQATYELLTR